MTWAWWRRPRPAAERPAAAPDQRDAETASAAPPARDAGRRPPGPPTVRTSPVNATRLHDVITARGYHVRVEPDASLSGLWDGYQFQLRLAGEEGLSTARISAEIHLAEGTVRNYLSSAIAKLGARNRTEAAATARDRGWL